MLIDIVYKCILWLNMVKKTKIIPERENPADVPIDSTQQTPNLKEDWCNLFLLMILYTIQGISFGLS